MTSEVENLADVLGPIGELAAHAATYAERGLDIFPVNPNNKAPLISQYEATTDLVAIDQWWHEWPTALIGHRLPEHQIVLDIDPRHGGDDTWRALKAEVGDLPVTRFHVSGRGDGGGHLWWLRPAAKVNTHKLEEWAKEHGVGHRVGERWTSGIDILQHNHRYTILPPSPHPDTGKPYRWYEARGLDIAPAPLPAFIADLIADDEPVPPAPAPPKTGLEVDSPADWYSSTARWSELLHRHGWRLIAGDGDTDGSRWKHPSATSAMSATIRNSCLFVYSTSTPFEPTEPGSPNGYTLFKAYAVLEHGGDQSRAARAVIDMRGGGAVIRDQYTDLAIAPAVDPETGELIPPAPAGPQPIDWSAFWQHEHVGEDWIVEPLIPRGRQVALWATHKTGKSLLSLEVAAAIATGKPVLGQAAGAPTSVVYIDLEMTEDDLRERLEEMGYGPDDNLSSLHYYLLPSLPPLDTAAGGQAIVDLVDLHQAELVVVDTMARAVQGDENDADTYRGFYRHTGLRLKQRNCALIRLDHAGKDPTKGQRGSSSKGDDVDVVWQLRLEQDGMSLRRTAARMSWVPEQVNLRRLDAPLRHSLADGLWPAGTKEASDGFIANRIDPELSQTKAIAELKQAGFTGKTDVLRKGWKHWQQTLNGGLR